MKREVTVLFAITVAVLFGLVVPRLSYAGFQKVKINVFGMTCEFCERALEKNLSRVPGVESARAWLDKGIAEVTLKKGARLDIEKLARAVIDGGVSLKNIEVAAVGKLTTDGGGKPLLKVGGNHQVLDLRFASTDKYEALKGSEVTVLAEIAAEKVKDHLWEVKEVKRNSLEPSDP